MGKQIDETGNKYGKLTALYKVKKPNSNYVYWHCKCECGNELDVTGVSLRSGNTKSCGCLQRQRAKESNINRGGGDLTGKQFGDLTVNRLFEEKKSYSGKNARIWECTCKCGNIAYLSTYDLHSRKFLCCNECINKKFSEQKFIDETGNKYGKLTVLSYVGKNTDRRDLWLCQCECGNQKVTTAKSLRAGLCQSCGCIKSKGEEKINQILKQLNYNYKTQFYFNELRDYDKNRPLPLYFDFAVFNKDNKLLCLIEYQGEQHYPNEYSHNAPWYTENELNDLCKRDNLKREYCIKNNIPLIEIKYTDYDKINLDYIRQVMQNEGIRC